MRKFALLFIAAILLTLCACGKDWEYLDIKEGGQTFEEIAAQLNELGINGFDQEMINAMQESWDQIPAEIKLSINKTAWLLEAVGMGNYDYERGHIHLLQEMYMLLTWRFLMKKQCIEISCGELPLLAMASWSLPKLKKILIM